MKLLIYPHMALRKKAKPIKQVDRTIHQLARGMFDLMYKKGGIGLAATQVGKPVRLVVVNLTRKPSDEICLVNPEIKQTRGEIKELEGCLSLPGIYAPVTRYQQIITQMIDLEGREIILESSDLLSRVIQHEIDHLDGVLFIDRLTELERKEISNQIQKLESRLRKKRLSLSKKDTVF